jgi:hypothetical protein
LPGHFQFWHFHAFFVGGSASGLEKKELAANTTGRQSTTCSRRDAEPESPARRVD